MVDREKDLRWKWTYGVNTIANNRRASQLIQPTPSNYSSLYDLITISLYNCLHGLNRLSTCVVHILSFAVVAGYLGLKQKTAVF